MTFLVDVVHDTAVELEVERNIAYERALTKLGCIMQVYVERTLPNVAQFLAQLIDEVGHLIRSWCEGRTPCLPQHKGTVYIHVHVKLVRMSTWQLIGCIQVSGILVRGLVGAFSFLGLEVSGNRRRLCDDRYYRDIVLTAAEQVTMDQVCRTGD